MNETQKKILLTIVRDTVKSLLSGSEVLIPRSSDPQLNTNCGCFVTLKNNDQLRGCIGQFTSQIPLIELIAEMAKASAAGDSRFVDNPITVSELNDLDIEISILSPPQKTDDPLSLRLGVDGIYIKKGASSGCFLPQVATETGWNKKEFLSYCCSHKAGLSANAWKQPETEVYLFTAEVFGTAFSEI